MKSKPKHPRCRKGAAKYKKALLKRMWDQMGSQSLLLFIGINVLGHDDLPAKHCYFTCPMPRVVNGIKNFDKDNLATKYCSFYLNVCDLVILIKNFDPINIRRSRAPEIMFSSEVIMTKALIHTYQKRGLSCPLDFTSFKPGTC